MMVLVMVMMMGWDGVHGALRQRRVVLEGAKEEEDEEEEKTFALLVLTKLSHDRVLPSGQKKYI